MADEQHQTPDTDGFTPPTRKAWGPADTGAPAASGPAAPRPAASPDLPTPSRGGPTAGSVPHAPAGAPSTSWAPPGVAGPSANRPTDPRGDATTGQPGPPSSPGSAQAGAPATGGRPATPATPASTNRLSPTERASHSSAGAAGQLSRDEQAVQTAAQQAASKMVATSLPGASAVGADKAAGQLAAKIAVPAYVTGKGVVLTVLLVIAAMVGATLLAVNGGASSTVFQLPPSPESMEVASDDAGVETAADLMPEGWADVVYDAQKSSHGGGFGVPWTVIAGLARTQSDFGRRSPYDTVDRDPDRPPRFGPGPGAEGSSGAQVVSTGYDGDILLLGDDLVDQVAARLSDRVDNPVTVQTASRLDELPAWLPGKDDQPDAIGVVAGVPETTDGLDRRIRAVLDRVKKGASVYWVNGHDPSRPGVSEAYNAALERVAAGDDRLRVLKFRAEAAGAPHLVTRNGTVTDQGLGLIARMVAKEVASTAASGGWVMPLPAGSFSTGSYFGKYGPHWWATGGRHTGQDFSAPSGTPMFSAAAGVVSAVTRYGDRSYGTLIVITHAGGITSRYAHSEVVYVKPGDNVRAGQRIALVGALGNTTGPHLHMEVKLANGNLADPMDFLPASGRTTVSSVGDDHPAAPAGPGLYAAAECDVSTISPPIGGGNNQATGPFLLLPQHTYAMRRDELNPHDPCDQAEYVAEVLSDAARDLYLQGGHMHWWLEEDKATEFWRTVVASTNMFADPNNGRVTCEPGEVGRDDVAWAIRTVIECEAARVDLEVVVAATATKQGITFDTASGTDAADQLVTEALTVAHNFSGLDPRACVTTRPRAGLFGLTKSEAARLGISDRCDPAREIHAVAKHLVTAESQGVSSRPADRGPFQPMLGGWQGVSFALGQTAGEFARRGPRTDWEPSDRCVSTTQAWLSDAAANPALAGLTLATSDDMRRVRRALETGHPMAGACAGATPENFYHHALLISETLTAATTAPADALEDGAEPDPVSNFDVVTAYLQFEIGEHSDNLGRRARPGRDSLVPRLSREPRVIDRADDDGYQVTNLGKFPVATAAVDYAMGYGGLAVGEYEPSVDVLSGGGVFASGAVAANGKVETVIAAAKSYLGTPYSWGGGGPSGPSKGFCDGVNGYLNGQCSASHTVGFDCSGLTEYAYAKAGAQIGSTSRVQATKGTVVNGLGDALRGDLLFWGAPIQGIYHVAIYLGDGKMIEAPRTGGVVQVVPVKSGVSRIVRIFEPEAGSSSISYKATTSGTQLASRLPAGGKPYAEVFVAAGKKHQIDAALLAGVAMQESGFSRDVIECRRESGAGARGMMQFMPATASGMGIDPCDPVQAVDGAARYLKANFAQFGRLDLALAAYNAGPGNVRKYGGVPPFEETRNYVASVPRHCRAFGGC